MRTWYSHRILWRAVNIGLSEQINFGIKAHCQSRDGNDTWDLGRVMKIFEREVDVRELAAASNAPSVPRKQQFRVPTATTWVAGNQVQLVTVSTVCTVTKTIQPAHAQLWLMSVLERRSSRADM